MVITPKLFTCLKGYTKEKMCKDTIAGIIVAVIALPLSIALAIASGVSPEKGLVTAIVGGFFVSLLGGSRVQIGGPTGAFVVIVLGILSKYGIEGLVISTFMAGVLLVFMGLVGFGSMVKFIPYPITTGFTSGIAIIIFSTQVKDFLGLEISNIPSEFIGKWHVYLSNLDKINFQSLFIGVLTIATIMYWPKINQKIPGTLIAIIISTILVKMFHIDIATIETQFGEISGSIPTPSFPHISMDIAKELAMPSIAIALLGSIESLLSAVVADGMIGGNHRSNAELVGQGVANMASSIFGGIPVTGAIARTAANIKNGGRTPISGIVHSISLLLMMLVLMPYVKFIPMSSLAGILIVVSYNMGEWDEFKILTKCPKSDALVFIATFALTLIFDLVVAIEVGMVLSIFLFMKRMIDVAECTHIIDYKDKYGDILDFESQSPDSEIAIYKINGPFFFGAADKFMGIISSTENPPNTLIIKMKDVPVIDATGYYALNRLYKKSISVGTRVILTGLNHDVYRTLDRYGFLDIIGEENVFENLKDAIVSKAA